MKYVLTGAQMSACDHYTSETIGIPSLVLMERAALSVAQAIMKSFPDARRIAIMSGNGNNGADGVAAGRILIDHGYDVVFFRLPGKVRAGSSMETQLSIIRNYGCEEREYSPMCLVKAAPDLIVDAMFGTGLSRDLQGSAAEAAQEINRMHDMGKCRCVAVDIPSGISSDDGSVLGQAVSCDSTVTFAYYKRGHFLYPGAGFCGKVQLCDIGITDRSLLQTPDLHIFDTETPDSVLGKRKPDGHKGTFGKILIVAGSRNVCGAAIMAAEACLSSGAGMVKIFTREENRVIIQEMIPEAMLTTYGEADSDEAIAQMLTEDLAWADICAIGPGIGRDRRPQLLVRTLLSCCAKSGEKKPAFMPAGIVIDADALRIIAADSELEQMLSGRDSSVKAILTPHIGEFADLIHVSIGEATADRIGKLRKLAGECRCTVIGKDARTVVASAGHKDAYLNVSGNSGMATAGSGDVLTGITAAFLALTDDYTAGCLAAWMHGLAGNRAAREYGTRSMTARSILEFLPEVLNDRGIEE